MTTNNSSDRPKVLYLASSQYSGSTLASFLLNMHPRITTVGHTTGWHFEDEADFPCSCGELLRNCPLFVKVAERYSDEGLSFDVRNFNTKYKLSTNERLDRYLLASLPLVAHSGLEHLRDRTLRSVGPIRNRLEGQHRSNLAFITAVLDYANADIFVDNSHDPFRLRHLAESARFDLRTLHLVRDPRGVALSCMKHANWSLETSVRIWVRRQADICRISGELPIPALRVYYEDLCRDVDNALARIHTFADQQPEPFAGDFAEVEHHILGNAMRLRGGQIKLDERWRTELSRAQIATADSQLKAVSSKSRDPAMSAIIDNYLNTA